MRDSCDKRLIAKQLVRYQSVLHSEFRAAHNRFLGSSESLVRLQLRA